MKTFFNSQFTREEVRKVVFYMSPTKDLERDGLPALFYQKFLGTIGPNVVAACLDYLNNGSLDEGMNETLVTLIPKVQVPVKMTDFCPISLCNVIYKIIAKSMANRFRYPWWANFRQYNCRF